MPIDAKVGSKGASPLQNVFINVFIRVGLLTDGTIVKRKRKRKRYIEPVILLMKVNHHSQRIELILLQNDLLMDLLNKIESGLFIQESPKQRNEGVYWCNKDSNELADESWIWLSIHDKQEMKKNLVYSMKLVVIMHLMIEDLL